MNIASDARAPDTLDDLERYWTEALMPLISSPALPPDYPRATAAPEPDQRRELAIPLPPALAARVLQVAQGKPSRLLALVIAAVTLLLQRLHGSEQVSVLTPVTADASGDAATNRWLAVKTTIEPDEPIGEVLMRVSERMADAFTHQQFPFARLLELLGRPWPVNRAPLADVAVAAAGVSRLDVLDDLASDLAIVGEMTPSLRIVWRADLFAADTVAGFADHLHRMLADLLDTPETPVCNVRLLDADEEAAARAGCRTWDRHELPDQRVEALIDATAREMPEAIAFVDAGAGDADNTLTFAALVSRARALAQHLRGAGLQPGQRVAIALDAGLPVPIALLASLYCGAAFVPLDPRHPLARLRAIVAQVKPAMLIAEARLHEALGEGIPTLDRQAVTSAIGGEDLPAIGPGHADDLAYVMFTSGSTGEPNGVCITHRSLVNYVLWAKSYYLGDDRPGFALYSSIAFDLTLTSIFLPLMAGCPTIIHACPDGIVDMQAIFADPRIGVVKATPSHLKLLRLTDMPATKVRRLIVGGEAFEWSLASALQEALGPDAAIFNEYGPTEATIACAAHRFATSDRAGGTVPIGRAIWNCGLYLLDADQRPVAASLPGELWISGVPVAQGYFERPEQTTARFMADPFNPDARMYATGDRARYDAAGHLYYLGRRDEQVKFNGVRIEPNEIRAAVNSLPRIRDSVVRVVEDERRNHVMIAYYVARQTIDVSLLRAGLLEKLPPEMIPTIFVRMARVPLTLNGKVDLDRLPTLEEARAKAPQLFVAPRTDTERSIAAVWSEVLGVGQISVHSNFFELGGHSLLASQVAWKTTERLGIEMPLRLLFDAPTVAMLATVLDESHV